MVVEGGLNRWLEAEDTHLEGQCLSVVYTDLRGGREKKSAELGHPVAVAAKRKMSIILTYHKAAVRRKT